FRVTGKMLQRLAVGCRQCPSQTRNRRSRFQASPQISDRREIKRLGAPLQDLDGVELMAFDPFDQFIVKRPHLPGHTKGSIAKMAPGAPGNLAHFSRIEVPELVSVELSLLSEGHMTDIEIEPHADRIRGDEIFDVPFLIKTDLGIAGAWT